MLHVRFKILFLLIFILGLAPSFLKSEIQVVFLRWNAALCLDGCGRLRLGLENIGEVAELKFFPNAGEAELYWKPNEPFDYQKINLVMHYIGLYLRDIRLRVRGTIEHDDRSVYLRSIGDDTRFQLFSPIETRTDIYIMEHSLANHILKPEVKAQLLQAEINNEIVVIEGTLFEPWRLPLRNLIVEELKIFKN